LGNPFTPDRGAARIGGEENRRNRKKKVFIVIIFHVFQSQNTKRGRLIACNIGEVFKRPFFTVYFIINTYSPQESVILINPSDSDTTVSPSDSDNGLPLSDTAAALRAGRYRVAAVFAGTVHLYSVMTPPSAFHSLLIVPYIDL
jgi:hypothetical protein